MNTTKTIQQRTSELSQILGPVHGTPNWDRLAAYIKTKTNGRTLADYLNDNAVGDDAKNALIDDIMRIVTDNRWDETPLPPSGQADTNRPAAASKPAPKPAAPAKPTPPQARVLVTSVTAQTPPTVTPPTPPAPVPPAPNDPMAVMAQALVPHLLPLLLAKMPAQPSSSIDENAVRIIVQNEVANIFEATAKGIRNAA